MQKGRSFILFLFIFWILSSSKYSYSQTSFSKFKTKTITVDGLASEWTMPLRFYNNETKLFFAMINDSANLYLVFQSNDERNQVKINRAGMRVGVSVKTKRKCNATLDFPLTDKKNRFAEEDIDSETKPDIAGLKNTFLIQNTNMAIKGFVTHDGVIPLKDSSGINVALNWDKNNIMTYELVIPFKELFGANYTTDDLLKVITLDVEVNAVTRVDEGGSVDGSQAAMGASGMGATRGMTGGMPGGTGGERKERKPMFDANKLKQKFTLSFTP